MNFIHSKSPKEGIEALASRISSFLHEDKKVLWLIPGGSNIPIAVEVMKAVRVLASPERLNDLTITLTDERFGPVGHKDSNWEQLIAADFDFNDIQILPVIRGFPLEETVRDFPKSAEAAFDGADEVIGQFGIGADGHIAGMLPHSEAVKSADAVFSYEAKPFTRITLTSRMFEKISAAYVFVFGENKREAITNLRTKELSIEEQPAQILKRIRESYLYSDILPM